MKKLKKVSSLILIVCMLLSAVPVSAAEPAETPTELSGSAAPAESAQSVSQAAAAAPSTPVAEAVTVLWEDETLRGEYEKHFLMSDGSYQAVAYSYPVHELVNGVWVELPAPEQTARGDVSPDSARSNIIDNYVWENHGVQDNNSVRLYIGNRTGYKCRAFIRFATMPTIPAGATITAATMTVNMVSGTSTANNATAYQVEGPWESDTIQWSNMPTLGTLQAANISHNNKTKYQFSCLEAVQEWYVGSTTGQNENYGIMLRYSNETIADYNSVYSADCTDANSRPSMTISYSGTGGGDSFDSATDIYLDDCKYVNTVFENEKRYYKFVPPVDGIYLFYSDNACDSSNPYLRIYTANQDEMVSDDNSGGNNNFRLSTTLTGGYTYYIRVGYAGTETGSYNLNVLIAATDINASNGHLRNEGSLLYVDIYGSTAQECVHQWTYKGEAQSRWTMTMQADGYYTIRSAYGSKYYLGISDTNIATENIVLYPTKSNYTSWRIYAKSNGELFFEPQNAPGKVLCAPGGLIGDELQLEYISANVNNCNKWKIEIQSNTILEGQKREWWCWAASARIFTNHYYNVPSVRTQDTAVTEIKGSTDNVWGSVDDAIQAASYYRSGDKSNNAMGLTKVVGEKYDEPSVISFLDLGHVIYIGRGVYTMDRIRISGHASVITGYTTVFINGSIQYRYMVYDPQPIAQPEPWNDPVYTTGQQYIRSYNWICNGQKGLSDDSVDDKVWDRCVVVESSFTGTTTPIVYTY